MRLSITIDTPTWNRLVDVAEMQGKDVTDLVTQAILAELDRLEAHVTDLGERMTPWIV